VSASNSPRCGPRFPSIPRPSLSWPSASSYPATPTSR